MEIKNIIEQNENEIAFIVGNGINRYPNNPIAISWDELLLKLWDKFSPDVFNEMPKGMTITEFYDLLDIANGDSISTNFNIQKEACNILTDWNYKEHHKKFINKALEIKAPVLTTNFDLLLPESKGLKQFFTGTKKFTDFYPWTTYFADKQIDAPTDGFGIWYMNGFVKYYRSIRLGLSHYMGSVEKARHYLHKGDDRRLFSGKNHENWSGSKSWLHIIFNRSLFVFGLGLNENEVFIRWLLIERAKYFKKFPERRKNAWFITEINNKPDEYSIGKMKFLEGIGFKIIYTKEYDEIYKAPWQ
jgi:hypothetical protein